MSLVKEVRVFTRYGINGFFKIYLQSLEGIFHKLTAELKVVK